MAVVAFAGIAGLVGAVPAGCQTAGPTAAPAPPAAPLSRPDAAVVQRLAETLAADVAADSVGSVAAAVFAGDEILWTAAFGWADRADRRPATPSTIYRAGSISKSITALVLMRLVEDGVIALDQPVSDHLPEIRSLANLGASARPITYRHLASHTAGLAREPGLEFAARGPFMEWKRKLVAVIPATEVLADPGEEYRYSNIGYGLLGLALERAAGRPFEILVDSLVFRPLGMESSSLVVRRRERRRLATGYVNLPGDTADPRVPRAEHRGRGYKVPNGGVYSTVGDLARFAMAMTGARGDTVLADSLRQAMLTDQTPGEGRAGYGLGFQLSDLGTTTIAGHSGSVAGYTAYLAFDPATGAGAVLLRNYNRGETNLGATAVGVVLDLAEDR
jgi:CubicO group peptidase (beta-lactamase class C family)